MYFVGIYFDLSSHSKSTVTVEIITPRDPAERGCQLSLRFSRPVNEVHKALEKLGIVVSNKLSIHFYYLSRFHTTPGKSAPPPLLENCYPPKIISFSPKSKVTHSV